VRARHVEQAGKNRCQIDLVDGLRQHWLDEATNFLREEVQRRAGRHPARLCGGAYELVKVSLNQAKQDLRDGQLVVRRQ